MVGKHDRLLQTAVEHGSPIGGRVIVAERCSPAGKTVTFGKLCEALSLIHPLFGRAKALRVDVGRVDQGAVEKPLFVKHDRERVGLLSSGACLLYTSPSPR